MRQLRYQCARARLLIAPAAVALTALAPSGAAGAGFGLTALTADQPSSLRAFGPTLAVSDGADVSALRTGTPVARPLAAQLQLLMEAFLAGTPSGSAEAIRVQVALAVPLDGDGTLMTQIPVLVSPLQMFAVPGDWSPGAACQTPGDLAYVCALTSEIRAWLAEHPEATQGAELRFDLLGVPHDPADPDERASGVRLALAEITDL